ncbi:MAG: hypothetical protein NZ608_00945, partial [candidate division WOR-3 bacterium]|nr:hypothetical protein [candidate division WOR-3 bacterium]
MAFLRGRRDELSEKYIKCANEAVEECLKNVEDKDIIEEETRAKIVGKILQIYYKKCQEIGYEYHPIDIAVLWGIFEVLIPRIKSINPVKWVVDSLKNNKSIEEIHKNLKIIGVGKKLLGVFLRDIV